MFWARTFLIAHQEAAPARALIKPDRIPKMIPKFVSAGGGLLIAVLMAVWVGASAIIRQFSSSCRNRREMLVVVMVMAVAMTMVVVVRNRGGDGEGL